jgi:hypothetical protein
MPMIDNDDLDEHEGGLGFLDMDFTDEPAGTGMTSLFGGPERVLDVLRDELDGAPPIETAPAAPPEPTLRERVDQFRQRDRALRDEFAELSTRLDEIAVTLDEPLSDPDASLSMVQPHQVNYVDQPNMAFHAASKKSAAPKKSKLTREQAVQRLTETRSLSTDLLEPLGIGMESFLRFSQLPKAQADAMLDKLIAMYGNKTAAKSSVEMLGLSKSKSTGKTRDQRDEKADESELVRLYQRERTARAGR